MDSVKSILALDSAAVNRMTKEELKAAVSTLGKTANRRARRIRESGQSSSSYRSFARGGNIKTSGKNLNQLRSEFVRARNFLTAKNSTLSGIKSIQSEIQSTLRDKYGVEIEKKNAGNLFATYDKLREIDPIISDSRFKYRVIEELNELMEQWELSEDEILEHMTNRINEIYEEGADLDEESDFSEFFE